MTFLHPSLLSGGQGGEAGPDITPGTPTSDAHDAILKERREKFLGIIDRVIDKGFTEKGIIQFMDHGLVALGGDSIVEHLAENEDDAAYDRIMSALDEFPGSGL